jgi:murein DD-endopeptidase MepM/ murein hydrolase activator NlpD
MSAFSHTETETETEIDKTVVSSAHAGCYLATCPLPLHDPLYVLPPWALGVGAYPGGEGDSDEYSDDDIEDSGGEGDAPDLTIDPEDGVLSLINSSEHSRSYFVTVGNCAHVLTAQGVDLLDHPIPATTCSTEAGTGAGAGARRQHVTFVAVVPPASRMDLVTLVPKAVASSKKKKGGGKKKGKRPSGGLTAAALASIEVSSDIQEFTPTPPAPSATASAPALAPALAPFELEVFPLGRCPAHPAPDGWMCTQSSGGGLTHFAHSSTYHAVDFRCPVGTPVLALFDGVVCEVRSQASASGVHVQNLFDFNSIMIKKSSSSNSNSSSSSSSSSDSGEGGEVYAEYVHIHGAGVCVAEGDAVKQGQVLCVSGEAGFCPEPHLHLQIQRGKATDTPSVQLLLGGRPMVAGQMYPAPSPPALLIAATAGVAGMALA